MCPPSGISLDLDSHSLAASLKPLAQPVRRRHGVSQIKAHFVKVTDAMIAYANRKLVSLPLLIRQEHRSIYDAFESEAGNELTKHNWVSLCPEISSA